MIHIYSYYNYGGFKDLYLGTLDEKAESKYLIPLYKVYKQRLEDNPNDKKSADKIELWSSLIQIKELNECSSVMYPQDASVVISHSGYKVILKELQDGSTLLAVRDIPGHADEFDRPCPFAVMLIGDSAEDDKPLCILADYLKNKERLASFESFCSGIFEHDIQVNALKFHFQEFVSEIKGILSGHEFQEEKYVSDRKVKLLIIPETLKPIDAIKEQVLALCDIEYLYNINGFLFDTHKEDNPKYCAEGSDFSKTMGNNQEKNIWDYAHSLEEMLRKLDSRIRYLEKILQQ